MGVNSVGEKLRTLNPEERVLVKDLGIANIQRTVAEVLKGALGGNFEYIFKIEAVTLSQDGDRVSFEFSGERFPFVSQSSVPVFKEKGIIVDAIRVEMHNLRMKGVSIPVDMFS